MKFLQVDIHRIEQLFTQTPLVSGYYQWHRVLDTKFALYHEVKGSLNDYDVILVGMTKADERVALLSRIRDEVGDKAKLVVCMDYAIEMWPSKFDPHTLERELKNADMLFGGEPKMVSYLRALTGDKIPVELIVHPTDTYGLSKFRRIKKEADDDALLLIHEYNDEWWGPYLVQKDLPYSVVAVGGQRIIDQSVAWHFYPKVSKKLEYVKWLEVVSNHKCVIDSYHTLHNYGRLQVECAVLGVPVVGSNVTYAQTLLWPQLTSEPHDVFHQRELFTRLMEDQEFWHECVDYATAKVDFFGHDERKKEMLEKIGKLDETEVRCEPVVAA